MSHVLKSRFSNLSATSLSEVSCDVEALKNLLVDSGSVKLDSVDSFIRKLAHKTDHFVADPETLRAMRKYWSDLTDEDFGQISGRRSVLVNVLTKRYKLSRDTAWQQVNNYFTR